MPHLPLGPFGGSPVHVPADWFYPAGDHRIVRPTRRKEARRAYV
jgi:hypothetical protein